MQRFSTVRDTQRGSQNYMEKRRGRRETEGTRRETEVTRREKRENQKGSDQSSQ